MNVNPQDPKIIEYIKSKPTAKRPRGNPGGKNRLYKDIIAAFDIETTTITHKRKEYNFMYSWALQLDEELTIIGRTWSEFIELKEQLKHELNGLVIPVFVHNLKYEFQYLKILEFESSDVIASNRREVIKAFSDPFEFRCSYKLTGLSLEKFTENVKHKKLSGKEFNYKKIRYPWTKLNKRELEYITNDVLGLVEAIKQRNQIYNDSIYSMPITLTGYIRRLCRNNLRSWNLSQREKIKINEQQYIYLAGAFRGGNACANRYYNGEVVENVYHIDISSAYPSMMAFNKYPIANWQEVKKPSPEKLLKYIYTRKRAVISRVIFNNIRLKDSTDPAPYIAATHDKVIIRGENIIIHNRIKYAEQVELYITDIDFKLIIEQYDFDSMDVMGMIKNRYGYLPLPLVEIIDNLYTKKTELKGVDDIYYKQTKELINSIFGMTAQNPAKERIIYNNGKFTIAEDGPAHNIEKFNKTAFTSYAWGVWTSAYCRQELQRMIRAVGDDFIYCDTDGIFYINHEKHADEINEIIKETELRAERSERFAVDVDGVIHYLGAWETQEKAKRFITAGIKKYAWEDSNGLNIAIAGVHKSKGGKELKNIKRFDEGFIFKDAAGNDSIYHDEGTGTIKVEGKEIEITPYIILKSRTYTLGIYQESIDLVTTPKFITEYFGNRGHFNNEYIFG